MIISKHNKSYDTADGSEQRYEDRRQPNVTGGAVGDADVASVGVERAEATAPGCTGDIRATGARAARERWEDDGGPLRAQPLPVLPPVSPLEFSAKPSWSVLSLRDLNLAIRLGDWPDNPTHVRRRAVEEERARVVAAEHNAQRAASRAHAERNRDRNPWEHT